MQPFGTSSAASAPPPEHYCTALHFTALDGHGVPIASAVTKANNFCCFYKMASPCESPESSESACSLLGSKSTEGGPARLLPVTTISTPHTVSIHSSKQDGIDKQPVSRLINLTDL
jgi:hypothetical protein